MNTFQLTDSERNTISSALRVAVEQYERDAATCGKNQSPRLANTFREQAETARRWADVIDAAEAITIEQGELV